MNLRVELPSEVVDAIVDQVTARVLAELAENGSASTSEPGSPYLDVEEAAAYLRCSRQRVYDLLSQRRLSRVKEGGRTLVRRDEIEKHLAVEERRA